MKSINQITKKEIYVEVVGARAEITGMKKNSDVVTRRFQTLSLIIIFLEVANIVVHWLF